MYYNANEDHIFFVFRYSNDYSEGFTVCKNLIKNTTHELAPFRSRFRVGTFSKRTLSWYLFEADSALVPSYTIRRRNSQ